MPITKINDEHRDADDEGTNRCCFINLVEWDLRRFQDSPTAATWGPPTVVRILVYYTRLMSSSTNPDDINYEDQR